MGRYKDKSEKHLNDALVKVTEKLGKFKNVNKKAMDQFNQFTDQVLGCGQNTPPYAQRASQYQRQLAICGVACTLMLRAGFAPCAHSAVSVARLVRGVWVLCSVRRQAGGSLPGRG